MFQTAKLTSTKRLLLSVHCRCGSMKPFPMKRANQAHYNVTCNARVVPILDQTCAEKAERHRGLTPLFLQAGNHAQQFLIGRRSACLS
eukprot:1133200-Amphidinium_carterae.2